MAGFASDRPVSVPCARQLPRKRVRRCVFGDFLGGLFCYDGAKSRLRSGVVIMRSLVIAAVAACLACFPAVERVEAQQAGAGAEHPKSNYYRGGSQGRSGRRGGYSYTYEDSINTYGDARGRYGSANSLRDPMVDQQTNSGPFDHGFFFNSGVQPNGGDSPYMH